MRKKLQASLRGATILTLSVSFPAALSALTKSLARAFGPAIVSGDLHGQAVWWIGPLLGAAAAGWLWRTVLLPKNR